MVKIKAGTLNDITIYNKPISVSKLDTVTAIVRNCYVYGEYQGELVRLIPISLYSGLAILKKIERPTQIHINTTYYENIIFVRSLFKTEVNLSKLAK